MPDCVRDRAVVSRAFCRLLHVPRNGLKPRGPRTAQKREGAQIWSADPFPRRSDADVARSPAQPGRIRDRVRRGDG